MAEPAKAKLLMGMCLGCFSAKESTRTPRDKTWLNQTSRGLFKKAEATNKDLHFIVFVCIDGLVVEPLGKLEQDGHWHWESNP